MKDTILSIQCSHFNYIYIQYLEPFKEVQFKFIQFAMKLNSFLIYIYKYMFCVNSNCVSKCIQRSHARCKMLFLSNDRVTMPMLKISIHVYFHLCLATPVLLYVIFQNTCYYCITCTSINSSINI